MRIRVFKLRRLTLDDERYDDLTEHGYHPTNNEVTMLYKEAEPVTINVLVGDIIEVGGIRYIYTPSGIEIHDPVI